VDSVETDRQTDRRRELTSVYADSYSEWFACSAGNDVVPNKLEYVQ